MKITVKYAYAKELVESIYVERAKRVEGASFEFAEADLPPEARKAALSALAAGSLHFGDAKLLTGPPEELVEVIPATKAHNIVVTVPVPVSAEPDRQLAMAATVLTLIHAADASAAVREKLLDLRAAVDAEKAAKREGSIQRLLAFPLDAWLTGTGENVCLRTWITRDDDPVLGQNVEFLRKEDPRLEARAQEAEAEALRLREKHEARQRENKALQRMVIEGHGRPDQLERLDAGLLPEDEREAVIKRFLFGVAWKDGEFPTYVPLEDRDVVGCRHPKKFRSREHEGPLSSEAWECLKGIRAAFSTIVGAVVELRRHEGYCTAENLECGHAERLGVRVTIPWAGEQHSREYALPEGDEA